MSSSPSTTVPVRSTASTRSPSPSRAKPTAWPPSTTARASASTWVEPQPSLMLRPSGASLSAVTVAPRRRKISGADAVGGAVGAVQGDVEAGEVEVGEALVQGAQVVLLGAVQGAHAPDRRARRRRLVQARLDLGLGLVGELEAVGGEELDAVVAVGVVRGRDHGREVEAVAMQQQRRRRRGQHAAEQDVAARGGDAGGQGGLEHLAGLARVADDEHARSVGLGLQRGGAAEARARAPRSAARPRRRGRRRSRRAGGPRRRV